MKRRAYILLTLIAMIGIQSCGDGVVPNQCLLGGEVEHEVADVVGFFSFNEELKEYTIRYHVPGTIDSFLTGVICQSIAGILELPEEGLVTFSGQFLDDNDRFDPNIQIGGEEYFYLNLTDIASKGVDSDPK